MFSNLGPLFRATFRQAEQTDTRQAIIREEKENGRRKKEDKEEATDGELWEDSTSVSVDALRTFLINFLKGSELTDRLNGKQNSTPSPPQRMPEERTPVNTQTARALGAYQSMAEKTAATPPAPPPPVETTIDEADLVASDEIRLMHKLINDLEELSGRGMQTLTIERADSFLQSLENAVNAAKQ